MREKEYFAGAGAAWGKNQEPEPLENKSRAGAGAAKKFAGSPALITIDKKKSTLCPQTLNSLFRDLHRTMK